MLGKNNFLSTRNVCLIPKIVSLHKDTILKMIVNDNVELAK